MPDTGATLNDIVRTYWPILVVSFAVSLAATPLCRALALRKNIVDRPDNWLKPHATPIPYLGGIAIFLGWAAGVLLALVLFERAPKGTLGRAGEPAIDVTMMIGVLIAGLAIMMLGLLDDLRMMSPKVKLAGAVGAGLLLILAGLGDDTILVLLRSTGIRWRDQQPWLVLAYSVPLTLLITAGACNATNLIDGLDGLCSGVLGIISAGFLVLAVHLHLWAGFRPLDVQRVVLSLAMLGAALGFLPYNRSPAKIFMGDAGSMLLGLNAAVLLLLFSKSSAAKWMVGSLMVFGLPVADMLLTLARRWRNQRPLMQGDRSHFYDQLIDRGIGVRRVVAISYALAGAFVVVGCAPIALRTRYIFLVYCLIVAIVLVAVAKFKMVRLEAPRPMEPRRSASEP